MTRAALIATFCLLSCNLLTSQTTSLRVSTGTPGCCSVVLSIEGNLHALALSDTVTLNVAIRNDGPSPVFIGRAMGWGPHGGLQLIVRNAKGIAVEPPILDDTLLPPLEKPSAELLVKLENGEMFGVKREMEVRDLVSSPGNYTVTVEYSSILNPEFLDKDARLLPVLWEGHRRMISSPISITVARSSPPNKK